MKSFKSWVVGALALWVSAATLAAPVDIAGVKVEDSATVAGTKLLLNGAGIRYKGPFKVYVAELYTTKKVTNLEELVAAPGPKRMVLVMTREIEAGPFGKLLTRAMEDNNPKAVMSKLVPGLMKMSDLFTLHKNFVPGDMIVMDWVPGTGLVVTVKGKVETEPFKEPEFFKALMGIWLGPSPAYWKLKDNLMGDMS
ncbi:MAG: chalcone isomerase family protein [Rhodoferax sp.]